MIVTAKSIIEEKNLRDKRRKGARHVELHLLISDVYDKKQIQTQLITLKNSRLKVVSVHSPMERICTLEGLLSKSGFDLIDNTCHLAQRISNYRGKDVNVVMHHELDYEQMMMWDLIDRIGDEINVLLHRYKNVIINIENTMPVCMDKGSMYFANSYAQSQINICEHLRKYLRTDRIGVVVDTCHIMASSRILERLGGYKENLNLEDIIINSKEYLNIVHLANGRGLGFGDGHGCGFETNMEREKLRFIIDTLKEIEFNGNLVLEVAELNYLDSVEFEQLFKQVNNLI